MAELSRRHVLGASLLSAGAGVTASGAAPLPALGARRRPDDETYWQSVRAQYDLPSGIIQLENGNWGAMARPVLAAYTRHLQRVNTQTSFYTREHIAPDYVRVHARVAANLGVSEDEIAFTRGATESLMTLIGGYNRLRPGDQLLYADLDYDSTQAAFDWLVAKRGVQVVKLALPEPASYQNLIDAYDRALGDHPKVRLMLLTHVSHRTGLVLPVAEIMEVARRRGVDVIVDSAHAWGQLDFRLPDLKADFVGLTCQKWIGAPIGVGVMYVRRERIGDIDVNMGNPQVPSAALNARVHTGTADFAARLTVDDALDFHEYIGVANKEARLRYLRDRWAEAVRAHPRIEVLTPADPRLTCALTSFRIKGAQSEAENRAIAAELLDRFKIFTVERSGLASGACVRVTPGIFTDVAEVDAVSDGITMLAAGRSALSRRKPVHLA